MRHSIGKQQQRRGLPPVEGITKKADGDSQQNLEKTAMEATLLKFKLNPNTATLVNINLEIIEVIQP